jgi:hypothetical protein
MLRKLGYSVCLGAALSMSAACVLAQSPDTAESPDTTNSAATSVAFVYVSYAPDIKSSNTRKIFGYKAWADGTLTAMPQSPFNDNAETMAVNGKYLMAASNSTTDIETYLIEYGGVLSYVTQTEYAHYAGGSNDCGGAGQIFFDHTGSSLYVQEFDTTSACTNSGVASFALNKTTGGISYLGFAEDGAFPGDNGAAYFLGNNVDAYSANNSSCMYYTIFGYRRASNGLLNGFGYAEKNSPTPSSSFNGYVPNMAVADPTNHVAVHMQPASPPSCANLPPQIAVYTADSNGYLTTTSTYSNMPATLVKTPLDMKMSSSGKLLAVGGQEGLQIFHWNGASPATHYTNLITTAPINQMFWDNSNHLLAISQSAGKVYAWTITPTGWSAAPGSPHALPSPFALIVQPH